MLIIDLIVHIANIHAKYKFKILYMIFLFCAVLI